MPRHFKGLTWDHPRGFEALAYAAAQPLADGGALTWDKQPLEGFESHPIADICARYDIVVLDHPHVGEAVARRCLQPLDALFSRQALENIRVAVIGPCYDSYTYAGKPWALPLDAATQVMATRADLLDDDPPLDLWSDIMSHAAAGKTALSLAGPHAVLTFLSIAAAAGQTPPHDEDTLVSVPGSEAAWHVMRAMYAHMPKHAVARNPIELLDHMTHADDIALCPLIYGYVNYSQVHAQGRRITYRNAPRFTPTGRRGSTLGGTGLAISAHCTPSPALLQHLHALMQPAAQHGWIPDHAGQPSLTSAWQDARINAAAGNFYQNTRETICAAYVRPRHDGYIAFQSAASAMLREALTHGLSHTHVYGKLNSLHRRHRPPGAEP